MLYAFMYHVLPLRIVDVSLQEPPTRKALALLILTLQELSASPYRRRRSPLTNPANTEISRTTFGEVEISAYFVNAGCKIGYIRLSMRPHLQPAFPCLAGFFSVWQSVDFVNILRSAIGSAFFEAH